MEFLQRPQTTNDYKYSNWRSWNCGTASVHHQEKYWFDSVITNRYLNWLCYDVYPNKKVGLVWDQAPQYIISKKVKHLIEKLESEGRLVLVLIAKDLTLIMQVCEYYRWRVQLIKRQRQIVGEGRQLTINVPTDVMIGILEKAVIAFNE